MTREWPPSQSTKISKRYLVIGNRIMGWDHLSNALYPPSQTLTPNQGMSSIT